MVVAGCVWKLISQKPTSQRQLNNIINISRNGVEVKGDAVACFCEVDTLVGAKDGGRGTVLKKCVSPYFSYLCIWKL